MTLFRFFRSKLFKTSFVNHLKRLFKFSDRLKTISKFNFKIVLNLLKIASKSFSKLITISKDLFYLSDRLNKIRSNKLAFKKDSKNPLNG